MSVADNRRNLASWMVDRISMADQLVEQTKHLQEDAVDAKLSEAYHILRSAHEIATGPLEFLPVDSFDLIIMKSLADMVGAALDKVVRIQGDAGYYCHCCERRH